MKMIAKILAVAAMAVSLSLPAGGSKDVLSTADNNGRDVDLQAPTRGNRAAYIPPQCYTKTRDVNGAVHNPCYTCHLASRPPNYVNDQDVQLAYDFPKYATRNRWANLFEDRSARVAAISDEEILTYVRTDNYKRADGRILLADRLSQPPAQWDSNGDGRWGGYTPDSYFDFDEQGFDRRPDGSYSGWRVFAYAPFPGTFWPTNGSTDDVLIRLPAVFRQDDHGHFDPQVYRLNLAIVESLIKREDVAIEPVLESDYDVDLNRDGEIVGMAESVVFDWDPRGGRDMAYVGAARQAQASGDLHLAAGLYPEQTELLHSVRYIDVADSGAIKMAARMKELRYAKKRRWLTYAELKENANAEVQEKQRSPDRLRKPIGSMEYGIDNSQGWVYQGFIEDAHGALRPQTFEETLFCVGCHSGIGATTDGTFALPRKFASSSLQRGWYHWSQKDLRGTREPVRPDGRGEYAFYLAENGAADELRENFEAMRRFFRADGGLKAEQLEKLRLDIGELLYPSRQRAMQLNKAYRAIAMEQGFWKGRDATSVPAVNVHREVLQGQATGIAKPVF